MSQTAGPDDFQLADYGGVLRRRWWLVVVVTIIGAAAGAGYFKLAHKEYTATASVYVTASSTNANQVANGRTTGTVNLDTEAQVVQSTTVAQGAAKLMHSPETVTQLIKRISVTVPANSQVLAISCQGTSPAIAANCAESFAKSYLSYSSATATGTINSQLSLVQDRISSLESDSAKLTSEIAILPTNSTQRAAAEEQVTSDHNELGSLNTQVGQLTADLADPSSGSIISDATPPQSATSPKASLVLPSGVLAGLIIGLILAFIVDRRDHRIRRPRDVIQLNVPVLMSLPPRRSKPDLAVTAPRSPDSRKFAELAHLLASSPADGGQVIMVTNVSEGRGSALVAANLAAALSRSQPDVILVCADLEGSAIPGMVGLPATSAGLTEVLADLMPAEDAVAQSTAVPRLRVMTPGAGASHADELQQDAVERLFTQLRSTARYIVVEAPPVTSGSDVYTLAHVADTVILVAEIPRSRTDEMLDGVQLFERMNAAVSGMVLVPTPRATMLQPGSGVRLPAPAPAEAPAPAAPEAAGPDDTAAPTISEWRAAEEASSSPPRS